MRNPIAWLALLTMLVVWPACVPIKISQPKGHFDYEGLAEEMAVEINHAVAVLNGVNGKKKARQASRKLDTIYQRLAALIEQMVGRPAPTPEQKEAVDTILSPARQNLSQARKRIEGKISRYPSIAPMLNGPAYQAFGEFLKNRRNWRSGSRGF